MEQNQDYNDQIDERSETEIEREFAYRSEEVVRRQRFGRRPKTTSILLNKIIAKRGFAETRKNEELEKIWSQCVGPVLAKKTRLGSIRKKILQVFVFDSVATQHLTMIKAELVADLKHKYTGIDDIRFKVGN